MTPTLVAGESIEDLARALREFRTSPLFDGGVHVDVELEPEVAAPLVRALMRIEADLLREDADQLSASHPDPGRTHQQRQADALGELVRRFSEALAA